MFSSTLATTRDRDSSDSTMATEQSQLPLVGGTVTATWIATNTSADGTLNGVEPIVLSQDRASVSGTINDV